MKNSFGFLEESNLLCIEIRKREFYSFWICIGKWHRRKVLLSPLLLVTLWHTRRKKAPPKKFANRNQSRTLVIFPTRKNENDKSLYWKWEVYSLKYKNSSSAIAFAIVTIPISIPFLVIQSYTCHSASSAVVTIPWTWTVPHLVPAR